MEDCTGVASHIPCNRILDRWLRHSWFFSLVRKTMLDSINKQQTTSRISGNEDSWQRTCSEGVIIDSEKECPSNCPADSEKNETGGGVRGQGYRCKFKLIYRLIVTPKSQWPILLIHSDKVQIWRKCISLCAFSNWCFSLNVMLCTLWYKLACSQYL